MESFDQIRKQPLTALVNKIVDFLSESSMKHYPRADSAFKKFQSLDFQEYRAKIYETHELK